MVGSVMHYSRTSGVSKERLAILRLRYGGGTMKATIFLVVLASIVIGVPAGCMHMLNEEDRELHQRESDWLHFSMEHHCKVIHQSSFSDPATTWQCDGFEVRR